jgi:opacity protein-like surface antigen
LSPKFSVAIEVQGITKGFHFKDAATHKILYLDMIPQAEYKPINLVGIVLGVGTSLSLKESIKVGVVWQDAIFNFSNKINLSSIAGIRLYSLKKWNISVQYSNTNLGNLEFTDTLGNRIDTQLLKLGTVKLGIGYRFI